MNSRIKISVNYDFVIKIDYNSEEEFNTEFEKLTNIINNDVEKFVLCNLNKEDSKTSIMFEIE
jgi:hypothetical protein